MSVKLYDDALIAKLSEWTKNTQIHLMGPNDISRLWQVTADTNNDKPIELPLISLSRSGGYTILDSTKRNLSFDGATIDLGEKTKCQLNAIPISIPYQLDVYTRYFEEADEFSRNLVFNIVNYPKLDIVIPYEGRNYHHDSNIRMTPDVEDNSDIPERLISGQFTRNTIHLTIDDAYLFDVRYRPLYTLITDTCISDKSMEDVLKDTKLV